MKYFYIGNRSILERDTFIYHLFYLLIIKIVNPSKEIVIPRIDHS